MRISCNLKDMKGNKEMARTLNGHETNWKDMKWREGKLLEMNSKINDNKQDYPPQKIKRLYFVPLYWFLITFGPLCVPPCPIDLVLDLLSPQKIKRLYLVPLYWFLITFGLLWGAPLPNWLGVGFAFVLSFSNKTSKNGTNFVVCRFGEASNFNSWKDMKKKWITWKKRNWMHM